MNSIATNWKYIMPQWSRSIISGYYVTGLLVQMRYPLCELSCIRNCSRKKYIAHIIR